MKYLFVLTYLLFFVTDISAQEIIYLENPSFEGEPLAGTVPTGWYDCGFPNETPPDIQPSNDPDSLIFGNSFPPYDGNTYLAMVVRDNKTWECVSQALSTPVRAGEEYQFNVYLARPEYYLSPTKKGVKAFFTIPTILRVFGGNNICKQAELLCQSSPVESTEWEEYTFTFRPEYEYNWLFLEAFYDEDIDFPYNGGIFLDNCSPIMNTSSVLIGPNQLEIELLIERIRDCYTLEETVDTLSIHMLPDEIIKRTIQFESTIYEEGMEGCLRSTSYQDYTKLIASLNAIHCEDLALLLMDAGSIFYSGNDSHDSEDKKMKKIDKIERKCLKILDSKELIQKVNSYTRFHFNTLNTAVQDCD